ncbi:hypothetical protein BN2497_13647 [Janthinobacterium sp. CG23_2]|nr:hypothetical protein BN2497_13647 [Janthinobacterium sp. CG23_2]CUU33221.1 hypothetical protein BN3177_13647 [Janthinobacterium sp. CG23_2]
MQADYTRKTQEVAETRKQIEARAAQVGKPGAASISSTSVRLRKCSPSMSA